MIRLVLKYCFALVLLMSIPVAVEAQQANDSALKEQVAKEMAPDSVAVDEDLQMDAVADSVAADEDLLAEEEESKGVYQTLKTKFIEGNAGFMSLVALALVLGLAFCIERIIYLTMSEINTKRFMGEVDKLIESGDIEGAKELCRNTRGPVASVCYQGLVRIDEPTEEVERSVANYGSVMVANRSNGSACVSA